MPVRRSADLPSSLVSLLPSTHVAVDYTVRTHWKDNMVEAVRLVIWDLDDTFWKGTVTEGGITEYIQLHHDIVVELAKRGILSSICSKNDMQQIIDLLKRYGIFDYFVFPSISWDSKGPRLKSLVEAVQLRAATVMFIDDNPNNRAEAKSFLPDLQIEDETFIAQILDDPRFKGKEDHKLSRLSQYKLLKSRKQEQASAGDNKEFLRNSDIRVYIEHDTEAHLDRAVELINRTNQLNFTKKRLSEDPEIAGLELLKQLRGGNGRRRNSGLVRVIDKYGDYGFVGFFLVENTGLDVAEGKVSRSLLHYCFSCRTLGMGIEQWLYSHLQRPDVTIVGEVLGDLVHSEPIDWIEMVSSVSGTMATIRKVASEI